MSEIETTETHANPAPQTVLNIGQYNTLTVIKTWDFGIYLNGLDKGDILMPIRYVPQGTEIGDELEAFIYFDSEDRIIATTEEPYAEVGDFAFLKAVADSAVGAFLDWGLPKDLLVPFREQKMKMEEGKSYIVHVLYDEQSNRIFGTAKVDRYLDKTEPEYELGEAVDLLIMAKTDLGFKAIINDAHIGVLYFNEVFRPLRTGDRMTGFIKNIREDKKIDLMLTKPGYSTIEEMATFIESKLKRNNGILPLGDKTDAEIIYESLGISKKNFKKACGLLYKQKKIKIEDLKITSL